MSSFAGFFLLRIAGVAAVILLVALLVKLTDGVAVVCRRFQKKSVVYAEKGGQNSGRV